MGCSLGQNHAFTILCTLAVQFIKWDTSGYWTLVQFCLITWTIPLNNWDSSIEWFGQPHLISGTVKQPEWHPIVWQLWKQFHAVDFGLCISLISHTLLAGTEQDQMEDIEPSITVYMTCSNDDLLHREISPQPHCICKSTTQHQMLCGFMVRYSRREWHHSTCNHNIYLSHVRHIATLIVC